MDKIIYFYTDEQGYEYASIIKKFIGDKFNIIIKKDNYSISDNDINIVLYKVNEVFNVVNNLLKTELYNSFKNCKNYICVLVSAYDSINMIDNIVHDKNYGLKINGETSKYLHTLIMHYNFQTDNYEPKNINEFISLLNSIDSTQKNNVNNTQKNNVNNTQKNNVNKTTIDNSNKKIIFYYDNNSQKCVEEFTKNNNDTLNEIKICNIFTDKIYDSDYKILFMRCPGRIDIKDDVIKSKSYNYIKNFKNYIIVFCAPDGIIELIKHEKNYLLDNYGINNYDKYLPLCFEENYIKDTYKFSNGNTEKIIKFIKSL